MCCCLSESANKTSTEPWFIADYLPIAIYSLFPTVATKLFDPLLNYLVGLEEPSTKFDVESQIIIQSFSFQFINHFSVLFYIAFWLQDNVWLCKALFFLSTVGPFVEGVVDVMPVLVWSVSAALAVLNFTKLYTNLPPVVLQYIPTFIRNFFSVGSTAGGESNENWGLGSGSGSVMHSYRSKNRRTVLQDVVRLAVASAIQNVYSTKSTDSDQGHGQGQGQRQAAGSERGSTNLSNDDGDDGEDPEQLLRAELAKPPVDVNQDFLQLVIQYGYIVMFSTALPILPVLALLSSKVDEAADMYKFSMSRRPVNEDMSNASTWAMCLEVINSAGVATNAFLLCEVSEYLSTASAVVSPGLTPFLKSDIGKLASVVILEHLLFLVKFVMMCFIEDEPLWVTNACVLSTSSYSYFRPPHLAHAYVLSPKSLSCP